MQRLSSQPDNGAFTVSSKLPLEEVQSRLGRLSELPSVPAILLPLIRNLDKPATDVDVNKIVELISHDKSIAAQCLRMANSPLFGRWQMIDSIRGAVMALGITTVRDIATSCCVLRLLPDSCTSIDPRIFWEHSLGVAMVSRRLARRIGFKDNEKAYLAGLLHDIGIIGNLLILPEEFRVACQCACSERLALHEAEAKTLGFNHAVTGMLLGDAWHLAADVNEVIRRHHDPERASLCCGLNAVVNIADQVCRASGLGYGFNEATKPDFANSVSWQILARECSAIRTKGAARFASEIDMYANEVRRIVSVLFRFDH